MPSVKMLGNMMELKNPTSSSAHMAVWPSVSIDRQTRAAATMAVKPSTTRVGTFCSTAEPMKRPHMAPPQ